MPAESELFDLFRRLCETRSVTGEEARVAALIRDELERVGIEVFEDDTAATTGCDTGNLVARIPGRSDRWISFFAHMDTVGHTAPIEVDVGADGVFRSRGDTILGSDNKAAVAVLVEMALGYAREGVVPPVGIELVFTVAEEVGLRGAAAFDTSALQAPFGFVFDHPSPLGEVIVAAPTHMRLVADFIGTAAHAGVNPEDGTSAILAAANAIAAMELGRIDAESTANVGVIGGGSATNVIAEHCRIEGEARSLEHDRAVELVTAMVDACTHAATSQGADVDIEVSQVFRAYRLDPQAHSLAIAKRALDAAGFPPVEVATGGGSDANALLLGGYETVLLANDTHDNHSPTEWVSGDALVGTLAIARTLVEESAK